MSLRITDEMLFRTSLADITRERLQLARLQEQASSGLRINRPSDDPVGVRAATLLKAALEATSQFARNITQARSRIVDVEAALADTSNLITDARVIAIQARNGTLDARSREELAAQVEALHAQLVSSANRRSSGGYVFSGYTSDVQPFTVSGPFVNGSPAPTVAFTGDASEVQIDIDDGVRVRATLNGQRVFLGDGDGDGSPDSGREDLFDILATLRDALMNNDTTAVGDTIDRMDRAALQVSLERTSIGAVDSQLTAFEQRLEIREVDLTQRLSDVQDADSVAVFSELVSQETTLRASLAASARLLQTNLMDFLS